MRPLTLRYVRDVEAVERFYVALGLNVTFRSRPTRVGTTTWTELTGSGGVLALHAVDDDVDMAPHPAVSLAFEASEPLEAVVERLRAAGHAPRTAIVDESFGRSFTVVDPEGLVVQVNEHDRELQA